MPERQPRRLTIQVRDSKLDVIEEEFTTVKEDWNEYELSDGTLVRLKTTAQRIFRVLDTDGKPAITPDGEPFLVVRHQAQVVVAAAPAAVARS
jgi:hypothetical protein